MKLEGTHTFKASPGETWDLFHDQKHLKRGLPGCERLEQREPGRYEMVLEIGISAVKGTYSGTVEIADPEPAKRFRLVGEGNGRAGFVKGQAFLEFSPRGENTIVSYHGEVEVGGLAAGVGQRLLGGIAKMLLGQFFKKMEKELKPEGSIKEKEDETVRL